MSKQSNNGLKVGAAALIIIICGGYTYASWSESSNGLRDEAAAQRPPDAPPIGGFDGPAGRPSGGGGGRGGFGNPQRMMDELGLDSTQRAAVEKLRAELMENEATRDPRKFFEEARKLLTPEQQKKAEEMRGQMRARGEQMMARREAEAKKVLSPADFATWQRKAQEMRARFAGGRGPGGPGGPGGQRGGGQTQGAGAPAAR
jgi:Spy/CpxP family protein refolding chaperone